MEIVFTEIARKEIIFWKKSGNVQVQKKIQELLFDIKNTQKQDWASRNL
jgi:hypothetical protein